MKNLGNTISFHDATGAGRDIEVPEFLIQNTDLSIQMICLQISADMERFLNLKVMPGIICDKKITMREIRAFAHIQFAPEALKPAGLASSLRADPATVFRINKNLESAGKITVSEHHQDARAHVLHTTEKGTALHNQALEQYDLQCNAISPNILPRLTASQVEKFFTLTLNMQARAEFFASVKSNGRHSITNNAINDRMHFSKNSERYHLRPDIFFQMQCRRISNDYMTFIKRFAVSKLDVSPKFKIREKRVLSSLTYLGNGATAHTIALNLRIDPATATRAITNLLEDGLVHHTHDGYDEREKPLALTPAGKALGDKYLEHANEGIKFASNLLGLKLSRNQKIEFLSVLLLIRERAIVFAKMKRVTGTIKA